MPKFCINCGKPLKPTWKVCPYCGKSFYPTPISPSTEQAEPKLVNNISEQFEKKSDTLEIKRKWFTKKKIAVIIIVCSVILAGILIPVITLFSSYQIRRISYYVNHGTTLKSYNCMIPRATYNYYNTQPHPSHASTDWDYVATIITSYCTPNEQELLKIAQEVKSQCFNQNDEEELLNALLSFTQGINYKSELFDRAQYPLETLIDQGDCEDLSIFFGSLVECLGFEAVIVCVLIYMDGEWLGHAVVGVHLDFTPSHHSSYPPSHYLDASEDANQYWLCETTAQGWMIGELPVDPSDFLIQSYAFIE